MQFIADILSNGDIEEELVLILCSVIAFLVLVSFRNSKVKKKSGKLYKHIEVNADDARTTECDAPVRDEKYYVKVDKALRAAFEKEDYWQVLKLWKQLKHSDQSSIHLSMIIRAMRFCNKGAHFIVPELKDFFKAHPQECSIDVINDLLQPLARRPEDAQLTELLVRMISSLNIEKDSRTYEIVLTMHAASGSIAKTQEVMAEMKTNEVMFTPRATVGVMTMGLQTGKADVVLKAFTQLKPSWDERDTWAVSMFALERHKINVLTQVVTLACQKQKMCELSAALDGMTVPEEVMDALQSNLALVSDTELASTLEVLGKSGRDLDADPISNKLISIRFSRSMMKSLPPCKLKKSVHTDSDASTSEGSRSDSEEEPNFGPCTRRPPGLGAPPGF